MPDKTMYEMMIRRPDGRECKTAAKALSPELAKKEAVAIYGEGTEVLTEPSAVVFTKAELDHARAEIRRDGDIPIG